MATPTAPSQPTCSLGISERALSALRDEAVGQAEAARLAAHVERCAACRERLAAFDGIAAGLRSERPPLPDERLWRAIVASAAAGTSARRRSPRFSNVVLTPLPWSRLGAVAAIVLLIASFGALFSLHRAAPPVHSTPTVTPAATLTPTPTAPPQPTATPMVLLPAHPLTWQPVNGSISFESIRFAGDGESAYACSVGRDAQGNASLNIWHSSDRGGHWIPARQVPTDPTINACELVVDASDPSVAALAWAPRGGGAGDPYTGLMTTVDGGATWQTVPSQPFTRIDQLDSRGGVIYALRETANSDNTVEYHLWASSDRMHTWRQVDHGLPIYVAGFWLQPDGSGVLIVVSNDPGSAGSQLWSSPDGGATWKQLSVSSGVPSYTPARLTSFTSPNGIMARSVQGQFHICVSNATAGSAAPNASPSVTCSTDGGGTWHARPLLVLGTEQGAAVGATLLAIADDGAVLATGLGTLYRLPADADRWQSLGSLPLPNVHYCPAPGGGLLWSVPQYAAADAQGRIYTASYGP